MNWLATISSCYMLEEREKWKYKIWNFKIRINLCSYSVCIVLCGMANAKMRFSTQILIWVHWFKYTGTHYTILYPSISVCILGLQPKNECKPEQNPTTTALISTVSTKVSIFGCFLFIKVRIVCLSEKEFR